MLKPPDYIITVLRQSCYQTDRLGAFPKSGKLGGMTKTKAEIKTKLMAAMEQEIDRLLEWESTAAKVTMTDIEDQVLAMRRRISEETANELAQARVERSEAVVPVNPITGKRLHRKGKKSESAKRVSG